MPVPTSSNSAGTSLGFITIGAVMAILSGTSFLFWGTTASPVLGYIRLVALILGVALLAIGFGVGHIGRVAREAEAGTPSLTPKPQSAPASTQAANISPGIVAQPGRDT